MSEFSDEYIADACQAMRGTYCDVVTLVGGRFDGREVLLLRDRRLVTIKYDAGPADNWPPPARKVGVESYRRQDDKTFVHCRTPTAIGDDNLEFWEDEHDE